MLAHQATIDSERYHTFLITTKLQLKFAEEHFHYCRNCSENGKICSEKCTAHGYRLGTWLIKKINSKGMQIGQQPLALRVGTKRKDNYNDKWLPTLEQAIDFWNRFKTFIQYRSTRITM